MSHLQVYEELREKLDKAPLGFPEGGEGREELEILEILFSEDEADLAQDLPFLSFTVEDIVDEVGMGRSELEDKLDTMVEKKTVLRDEKDGETVYRLLPVVIGWFELPFASGPGGDERQEELAPLWEEYLSDAWLDELGDRDTGVMRALPEKGSISGGAQVLPHEDAVKLVKARGDVALVQCACRTKARINDEGCEHSLDNCLVFGSLARGAVDTGIGREISSEKALEILKEANQEGLVHTVENHSGRLNILCNCCECCCISFKAIHEAGHEGTIAKSSYFANVDEEECIACGICALRCPVNAITFKKNKKPAEVDEEKCIGCGVCHPTCPVSAVELEMRENPTDPLGYFEYIETMLEERGKDLSSLE